MQSHLLAGHAEWATVPTTRPKVSLHKESVIEVIEYYINTEKTLACSPAAPLSLPPNHTPQAPPLTVLSHYSPSLFSPAHTHLQRLPSPHSEFRNSSISGAD
jgi:hypothetical protein